MGLTFVIAAWSSGPHPSSPRVQQVIPDSKVSLFFPPHAVLLSILLLVPTRHWWAYVLAAVSAHFLATQQEHWPLMYALTCEAFDAVKCVSAAAGICILIKSPVKAITLRDAILFVLIAVVLVPFGTAFCGASFTVSYGFGTQYWIEWRNRHRRGTTLERSVA
jgi:integral membrane sensor domain MASE1